MSSRQPAHDYLSDDERERCTQAIILFTEEELDSEIGMLAAEDLLDSIQETVAKSAYNRGVEDAAKLLQSKLADTQIELDMLKKS